MTCALSRRAVCTSVRVAHNDLFIAIWYLRSPFFVHVRVNIVEFDPVLASRQFSVVYIGLNGLSVSCARSSHRATAPARIYECRIALPVTCMITASRLTAREVLRGNYNVSNRCLLLLSKRSPSLEVLDTKRQQGSITEEHPQVVEISGDR